jgi:hypothetical protein
VNQIDLHLTNADGNWYRSEHFGDVNAPMRLVYRTGFHVYAYILYVTYLKNLFLWIRLAEITEV